VSDVLAHLDWLEGRLGQLWPEQVYAFDLACVERQWPIYERSARGRPWDCGAALRGGIDAMWDWLRGAAQPRGFAAVCAEAIFSDTTGGRPDLAYKTVDDAEVHALFFVLHLVDLMESIEDERPEECVIWVRRTLDVVDSFISDHDHPGPCATVDYDALVDQHPLMRNAINQQNADLALVIRAAEVASIIDGLRVQASSQSILMDRWFPR
jgi:hypothetical protein